MLLASVSALHGRALDAALERLVESGLLSRRMHADGVVCVFKHALLQDAAYDSLLLSRRRELHRVAAEVLRHQTPGIETTEPELLAHHLTVAGETWQALELWQAAGRIFPGYCSMVLDLCTM